MKILTVLCLLLLPLASLAEDSAYWQARVAASIALAKPIGKTETRTVVKSGRSVMYLHTASWCAPCQAAKKALTKEILEKLPFTIEVRDSTEYEYPHPIPAFHWDTPNGPMKLEGWYGVDHLVSEWTKTQTKRSKTVQIQRSVNHYNPQWTWPGNLGSHLQGTHRVNVSGMTHDQMEQLHDQLHNGRR